MELFFLLSVAEMGFPTVPNTSTNDAEQRLNSHRTSVPPSRFFL